MKIVINNCFGGFSISKKAAEFMAYRGNVSAIKMLADTGRFYGYDVDRQDPDLIAAVEALGAEAGGSYAELRIVEIPDGIEWEIHEYAGNEHIAEKHRTWC